MKHFRPAIDNNLVVALSKLAFPLKLREQRLKVSIEPNVRETFKRLKGKRTVLLANHPDADDPYVIFQLSKVVGENFYYMAARDVFGVESPLFSWFGQNIGCYSIDRSDVDIEAIKMTMRLLKRNTRKIVIFPEGDLTGKDHQLTQLKEGTVHLLMNGQQRVAPEPIFVLPVGIHYSLVDSRAVEKILEELEQPLNVPSSGASVKERLTLLIAKSLEITEQELEIRLTAKSLTERSAIAGTAIVHKIAHQSGVEQNDIEALNLLYKLRSFHIYDEHTGKLDKHKLNELRCAERLLFMSHLLKNPWTDETMFRILQCVTPVLTGKEPPKTERVASVSLGEPIELLRFCKEYCADKESGIAAAKNAIKKELTRTVRRDSFGDRDLIQPIELVQEAS